MFLLDSFSFDENYELLLDDTVIPKFNSFENLFKSINSNSQSMISESNDTQDFKIYKFILSPNGNFIFSIGEYGIMCHLLSDYEPSNTPNKMVMKKNFKKSEILCDYTIFENYIQFIFENKVVIFSEDVYNKKLNKVKILKGKIKNKKILRIKSSDYFFIYYDHNMNIDMTQYLLKPNTLTQSMQLEIKNVNSYNNNFFFSLDSEILPTTGNNENVIYSLCGFKGNSKLIKLEKALHETKLETMENINMNCSNIKIIENKNKNNLVFLTSSNKTQIMKFTNSMQFLNLGIPQLENLNEKTVDVFKFLLVDIFVQILENSIILYELDSDLSTLMKFHKIDLKENEEKIILGRSFTFNNEIYSLVYLTTGQLCLLHFDFNTNSFILDTKINFSFEISCFDFILQEEMNKIFLIFCTYNNRIEMYNFSFNTKEFIFASNLNLENNEKTDIIPESLKIFKKIVCISTRSGEFILFSLMNNQGELCIQQFLTSIRMEDPSVLTITDILENNCHENIFEVYLHNAKCGYLLEVKIPSDSFLNDPKGLTIQRFKYIIKEVSLSLSNNLNFLKNFKTSTGVLVTLYQVNDKLYLSHFSKPLNSNYIADELIDFSSNQLARKIISYDERTLVLLVENYEFESTNLINNTILIYSKDSKEVRKILIDEKIKINTIKFIELSYQNTEEIGSQNTETIIKYLGICGNYLDKENEHENEENSTNRGGYLFIYECVYNVLNILEDLRLLRKLKNLGSQPTYDFCQIKEHLIFSSDGSLGAIKIDLDHKSKKPYFQGAVKQGIYNKVWIEII
jgi:hypothetical protein